MRFVVALVLTVAVLGCGGGGDPSRDVIAEQACRDYRSLAEDINRGIVSEDEAREAMQEVHRRSRLSDNAALEEHAEVILRGFTQGSDIGDSADAFVRECNRVMSG